VVLSGLAAAGSLALSGCSRAPLKVGFLGGMTGPAADLGIAGRDGALLCVEHRNAAGGVGGRPIELVAFDDRQRPSEVPALLPSIEQAGLAGLVGPLTSSVAAEWIPLANAASLVTVSPTATSTDFSGQADLFFRVCSTTREYAGIAAEHHVLRRSWNNFAILRDDSNAAYTRSWAQHFTQRVQALGGRVLHEEAYHRADPNDSVIPHLQRTLSVGPDVLVVVTNALDAARCAQWLRQHGHTLPMVTAEWAATEQLLELGGRAVEGVVVAQYFDRRSAAPAYQRFKQAFVARYQRPPGFVEVAAYDAMTVLLDACRQKRRQESLAAALQRIQAFEGLQQTIVFDAYGDASRGLYMTEVVNGEFVVIAT
jgi:branched-chain amino acid transport system substrate-binding protein